MGKDFRWRDWNRAKMAKHGVTPAEAERVVRNAKRPYPMRRHDDRWLVAGRCQGDRFIEVVYLIDPDGTLYIIHVMPLTTRRRRG
jgi:uncharacterized DUF497 family protein